MVVSTSVSSSLFLKALEGSTTERPPIWFMRQAGRCLPAYRQIRQTHSLDECFRTVDRAVAITQLPEKELAVDALVLFSDILLPLEALGAQVQFPEGQAPQVRWTRLEDLLAQPISDESFAITQAVVRGVMQESALPVIGFAGSPWTLFCYLLGAGRDGIAAKRLLLEEPLLSKQLLERLSQLIVATARAQVTAGASAFQVFDSCAPQIGPDLASASVEPIHRQLVQELMTLGVPVIWLGRGSAQHRQSLLKLPCALSIDWADSLSWWAHHSRHVLQGNLDPAMVAIDPRACETQIREIEEWAKTRGGMILNLGHGVLPDTPVESLQRLCHRVREGRWNG
ncbi:MAG: uroporphyrinogen decarboxylase family protein [Chlamydiia bacterium]